MGNKRNILQLFSSHTITFLLWLLAPEIAWLLLSGQYVQLGMQPGVLGTKFVFVPNAKN
jgi:hypothetical protein